MSKEKCYFKPVNSNHKFTQEEIDILKKNQLFFTSDTKYIQAMLEIIEGKSTISIRLLEWFTANYSKKNNTSYKVKIYGKEDQFYVNTEYKNKLNGYNKTYFDPFCRGEKIVYHYNNDGFKINFITSIGQLNFFQWAISKKVINYVEKNLVDIEEDMKTVNKLNRERKKSERSEEKQVIIEENSNDDQPDPVICSSETISSFVISPGKKEIKSDTDKKNKRRQLCTSAYKLGIKKSTVSVKLDFD